MNDNQDDDDHPHPLPTTTTTTTKLTQLFDTFVQNTAKLVAPDSLVLAPADVPYTDKEWHHNVTRSHNREEALKQSLKRLRPGDIILTRTPGFFYGAARTTARSTYDHCVVVARQAGMVIHVGPPTVRLLRVERIMTPQRHPIVFRCRLNAKQNHRFVHVLEQNLGKRYGAFAAYKTLATLSMEHLTGLRMKVGQQQRNKNRDTRTKGTGSKKFTQLPNTKKNQHSGFQTHIVCTDTIFSALCQVSKAFTNAIQTCEPMLDCVRLKQGHVASLEDVLRLHHCRPDLLVRIPLVTSLFPNESLLPSTRPTFATSSASSITSATAAATRVVSAVKQLNSVRQEIVGRASVWAALLNYQLEEQLKKPQLLKVTQALSKAGVVRVVEQNSARGSASGSASGNAHARGVVRDVAMHETIAPSLQVGDDSAMEILNANGPEWNTHHHHEQQQGGGDDDDDDEEMQTEITNVKVRWGKMQAVLAATVGAVAWTRRRKIMHQMMAIMLFLLVVRYGYEKIKQEFMNKELRSRL